MEQEDRKLVRNVIEQNTRRVSVDELAARGKRHVRVVSGERVLELIEAVVDQTIALRAGEIAEADRDRIVKEAETRFKHITRIQAEARELIEQQKAMIQQQERELAARQKHVKELVGALRRRERRMANARQTILSYDAEIERLAKQVQEDAAIIERLKIELRERDARIVQLDDGMRTLERDIADARARSAQGGDLSELKGEFAEMKRFLRSLEEVTHNLHVAAARPIDSRVEATDVVVSKIFDEEGSMESNLDRLDVHVSTTREGIASSLERLRKMRAQALDDDEPEVTDSAPP